MQIGIMTILVGAFAVAVLILSVLVTFAGGMP
jgi:hypothetical protein